MRNVGLILFLLLTLVCSALDSRGVLSNSPALTEEALRKPFMLELPDIAGAPITAAQVNIPRYDLHTIRLRVLKPYADSIAYGKIYTTINGESAGTIQEVRPTRDGYVVSCNLDMKPRFRLHPGKNVVEIIAVDRDGRSYYASYVLMTGGSAANDPTLAKSATIETVPVNLGEDREPPAIYLSEPKGAIQLMSNTGTIKVYGVVSDNSGVVASVAVNGQAASLSATTGARAIAVRPGAKPMAGGMTFERIVTIPAGMLSLTIEASDRAGNTTRMLIPVRRREAALSSRFSGRKFAVVIGVSRYKYHEGGLTDLEYADADARAIRDFLQSREGGGFAANDILYLENEQASISGVRGALDNFLPKATPDDLLFLFIAGHGAPDPYAPQNLYFLLHDTKVADMPNTALPMDDLKAALEGSVRAERVVVLVDTCHSAGLSGKRLVTTRGLENNLINLYATKLYKEKGRAVLTSSDLNEVSQESKEWGGGHGIFTLALMEAFRGEADTNRDNLVTAGELFAYVRDRVRVETAFQQNPTALPGLNADLTLSLVPKK